MSKRILVVEDQPDNRQIIRDMLASTDYEITEAEDGEQAFSAVAKARPDLILMGIKLPIMDGYEVTRQIKADPAMRSIPIKPLPPTRWMGKNRQRERQDVMAMCRSLTARANYWQKFSSACPHKCESLRTHPPRSVLIHTLPSRWVMGSNARLAHFYYAFGIVFLWRCYYQILGPRCRLSEFANGLCGHGNARLHFDTHMTRQATKSDV